MSEEEQSIEIISALNSGDKRRGRPGLPIKTIIQSLESKGGFITATAQALGITLRGLEKRISENRELKEAVNAIKERKLDLCESKLMEAVKDGAPWAVCFYLKCQGKHRGWVEKQEVEHSGPEGKPVRIVVEFANEKPNSTED